MFDVIDASRTAGKTLVVQRTGGEYAAHEAIGRAIAGDTSGTIALVGSGAVAVSSAIVSDRSGFTLELPAGLDLRPSGSGSIGLFDFSGSRVHLKGPGGVLVDSWVNDQVVVKFRTGSGCTVEGLQFKATTGTAGSASNPMDFLRFDTSVDKTVERCHFIPARGMRCIRSQDGNRLIALRNRFTNAVDGGFLGSPTTLACYRVIDIEDEEWFQVVGNIAFGLGGADVGGGTPTLTANDDSVDAVLRYYSNVEGSGGTLQEHGHCLIKGNQFEYCVGTKAVQLYGLKWGIVEGNIFGPNSLPWNEGEGLVILDESASGRTCDDVTIADNSIHNPSQDHASGNGAGASIYAKNCKRLKIDGNTIDNVKTENSIFVKSSCTRTKITNNDFYALVGAGSAPASPVKIDNGSDYTGWLDEGNTWHGFTSSNFIAGTFGGGSAAVNNGTNYDLD